MILATRHHEPTGDAMINIFLDADLSILGTDDDGYMRYSKAVRMEYSHVPDDQYAEGRRRVLARILARPAIYATEWFRPYESAARKNMSEELKML